MPRWMARLMLSAGMFSDFAARIAVRSRGFISGSPPDFAAIEISLIRRVKILPRLASSAPFLCLIVAHFEWPDMGIPRIDKVLNCADSQSVFQNYEFAHGGDHQDSLDGKTLRRMKIIAWAGLEVDIVARPASASIFKIDTRQNHLQARSVALAVG